MKLVALLFCAVLGIATACAAVEPQDARLDVALDLVRVFDADRVSNSMNGLASADERSGGVSLPGIFLHPQNADDAVVSYPDVAIPAASDAGSPWLLFRIGMRDFIPWDTAEANKPNGVRFLVTVNGETVFSEDVTGEGWRPRAVDLAPWAGQTAAIELRTNAIDGHTSYDWCVFGQPMLVRFTGTDRYTELPADAVGVALARFRCAEAATVTWTMGGNAQTASFAAGEHCVPVHFASAAPLTLEANQGAAELVSVSGALYAPNVELVRFEPSTPLLTAGQPFNLVLTLKNTGLGTYLGADVLALASADVFGVDTLGVGGGTQHEVGKLQPGESRTYRWDSLTAQSTGAIELIKPYPLHLDVLSAMPATPSIHTDRPLVGTSDENAVCAIAANEWSRLGLVKDPSGAAYAIAETWDGSAWRRAGTLYPLAQVAFKDAQGVIEEPKFRVASISASSDAMSVKLEATGADGTVWPAVLLIEPDVQAPRIHITTRLWAPCDAQLVSFYGPAVLAGDRAYGANKDFAIFPGVEYLEGAEESSSERDLVYPLSDRRVVLPYKIAAPVMAVQGQDTLIALLWDENQQWTPGMKHPAARFLAPKPDSGIEQVHMSLFAPSVGEFVKENTYGAYDTPFALKRGRDLKLDSWLVLDHAARHARDGVVHGPHKGGLVLQAMAQWFDVFGFPEPSPAPREWDAERALCRDAYANAVWSEDPPGWRHCAGWNAGLHVSQAVPQLVDIRAGMPEAERADAERRIDKVIAKALETEGKHYLWTNAGCHIMMGELPFYYGYVGESLANFRDFCLASLDGRKEGLWRWYPASEQHAKLGDAGGHTLGQASYPCMQSLRAARMTGDQGLLEKSLDAMRQMEQYEVPRGAQMWECPLYQPDILAAAQAIRAYCEAYRITGDEAHLAQARYWAWTGLPFLYTWELEGYPTMRYNVISVIGSTFFTHSWIGLPVVWCGEVYAYALQELAQYDDSLDWNRIAEGINHSAMWQQYTEGPSKGCYPDSWNMAKNKPNPSDINPENILVNEFRLKGPSPEIRSARFQCEDHVVMLNSAADIVDIKRDESGVIQFGLKGGAGFPVYTMLAPVPEPSVVEGVSGRAADSDALRAAADGWLYDTALQGVILKHTMSESAVNCAVRW